MIRLIESDIMLSIYDEITCINVVSLYHHFKHLWLMNFAFFHKVDDFILDSYRMVHIVV